MHNGYTQNHHIVSKIINFIHLFGREYISSYEKNCKCILRYRSKMSMTVKTKMKISKKCMIGLINAMCHITHSYTSAGGEITAGLGDGEDHSLLPCRVL